ncbi:hypothetical protein SELMODRAFT_271053 [Selaginella moellendorffii]|uniref:DJ-1/PfpI domain-containing protein n=1 Tax=Selaginella moellendorffii TaxID=88036 RepID=D8RSI9_SELML|nr:uncharacterized protein LOC9655976 [Selaginella moellendorffii]EFJ24875.1 hypothetical protein SELMODRAFT_271053 [Selaginella moellendorffii]|eukprot:XP_002973920.1 uncharacterized protein LOC9655976 [Selaginella moellendorffii]
MVVVAIPIFNGFTALDAIGPYEVLHRIPGVRVEFVSETAGLYLADDGHLRVEAPVCFEQVPSPDVLVVPGGLVKNLPLTNKAFLDYIVKVHKTSLYTTSVCTGALLLGAAGILHGLKGTTHWAAFDNLASYGVTPVHQRYIRQGKIIMSAGVSAGIDSNLEVAALLADETMAKAVQLSIEYDPQPPFDSGSVGKASKEVVDLAREITEALPSLQDQ